MTHAYEAIVYDLDGTLIDLVVDWEQVRREVAATLRARDVPVGEDSLWELFERATAEGFARPVEETLEAHERQGARKSHRLALADELPRDVPVGVCSLNAESACRIGLELHGLDGYVDTIVGRDTVEGYKPDPEPLVVTTRRLGVQPEQTLFVGDTKRDAVTAERAGTDFEYTQHRLQ